MIAFFLIWCCFFRKGKGEREEGTGYARDKLSDSELGEIEMKAAGGAGWNFNGLALDLVFLVSATCQAFGFRYSASLSFVRSGLLRCDQAVPCLNLRIWHCVVYLMGIFLGIVF